LLSAPSVIVGRKGSVGTVYWEDRPCFPIDTVFYVVPRTAPLIFCLYLLRSLGLTEMNTDAAVPGLNRSNAYRLSGPWGDKLAINGFDVIVSPMRQRMYAAEAESRTLRTIRDLLLPTLMSGKIQIKDAEKVAEATL
jgi:type I restriction enzyme S subunit